MAHEDTVVVETLAAQPMPTITNELHVAADVLAILVHTKPHNQAKIKAAGAELVPMPKEGNRHLD